MNNTNLKAFITWLAANAKQGLLAYEDKKITLAEIFAFVPLEMQVTELIPKAKAAWEEVKTGTTASIVDTLNYTETQLTFLKAETVAAIKNTLGAFLFGTAAINSFKAS